MSNFIRIVPSETTSPSIFPRPLQPGPRRKPDSPSRDLFSLNHSSRCKTLAKTLCGSGVPILTTQAHYEVFNFHYWIQLSIEIPRYVESITLQNHSHFKRYNASNPAQVVTDGDRYFCMSITTSKRDSLSSYKRITTCKSCGYGDPHDSDPHYHL